MRKRRRRSGRDGATDGWLPRAGVPVSAVAPSCALGCEGVFPTHGPMVEPSGAHLPLPVRTTLATTRCM